MNFSEALTYNSTLVREIFQDLCIDKSRLPSSGLTAAGVPTFVAEWLLDKIVPGIGSLTSEEQEKINRFIQKAWLRKDDKEKVKLRLTQGEVIKLIALMRVRVNLKQSKKEEIPEPLAELPKLSLENCRISTDIVERHERLLQQGSWGKISLAQKSDNAIEVIDFEPFQCSSIDLKSYADFRTQFSAEEWRDLMLCSMGFNPEHPSYSREAKMWILARLLPLVESKYHIWELAPKGTGKSFVFENTSNKVTLVSGGKIGPARLFFNGKTKETGLLGSYDVVVLDEIQSLTFDNPDEMIGPLKNYLASGRYNRAGYGEIYSDCSLVMLANIELNEQQLPRNENNLLSDLPKFLYETAFLDRFCGIIPGWKIPKFQREMTAHQVGLKMDFFGEVLLALRQDNRYMQYANDHTNFDKKTINIRDDNAILKSASGFLKILYPHLNLTLADYERDCLKPAIELRQYIRNLLYHFDDEFKQYGRYIYADVK